MKNIAFLAATALLCILSCTANKLASIPKPPAQYDASLDSSIVSTITIPVNISVDELVRTLNASTGGKALYEDYSYTDNNNDGLMLNAWKSEDISLFISGNTIKYRVPLKLWIKKSLVLGAEAEVEGNLALNFKTQFSIKPDWTLQTQTEVEYHEWLGKPVLKTGLGNINIEYIANLALNRSKKTLAQTLDQTVAQQFSFRPYLQDAWNALQAPVLFDTAYQMWIKTTPLSIGMTPLISNFSGIKSKIAVECLNDVTFGEKPQFRQNSILPNLNLLTEAPDDFQIRISTDVPFPEAQRLAKNMIIGQEFASGKKKVKVEDLEIWGNQDKCVVNTKLSGSFKGNIYFIGRPAFNPEKNQIEIKDLDFHVDTRNFLYKSAAWIFQGPIKKQMAAAMTFPLEENINSMKESIRQTLQYYEVKPGISLSGLLDSVAVENTRLTPQGFRVNLFAAGRVQVDVKGL